MATASRIGGTARRARCGRRILERIRREESGWRDCLLATLPDSPQLQETVGKLLLRSLLLSLTKTTLASLSFIHRNKIGKVDE